MRNLNPTRSDRRQQDRLVECGRIPMGRVWLMLAIRSAFPFMLLLSVASGMRVWGELDALSASAAWWLWYVSITNIICILLLARFSRAEGRRLRDVFFASKSTWRGDLGWTFAALAGIAVAALIPGMLLARALWGSSNYPNGLLIQPLPILAVYPLFVVMPVSQALAELPTYWGYVAPRLRASGASRWVVIGLVGAVLSVQHMFMAFQLDWRYDLWLALRYLPFALWVGYIVDRRPTSLPYLMGVHFLMDASLPVLLLLVSGGMPLS